MAKTKVFISYKRNVDPDQKLADYALEALTKRGCEVFLDRTMTVGTEWAKTIELKIRGCDYFLLFLTAASSASEMIKGEVEIARDQAARNGGTPRILPVRLAFDKPLPSPLSAWLHPIQYSRWKTESDNQGLIDELMRVMAGEEVPLLEDPAASPAPLKESPAYAAAMPPPGGVLDVDDPWYVERGADSQIRTVATLNGSTVIIKGSRQMGKTSLLMRMLAGYLAQGKRCAWIDFQNLDQDSLANGPIFFRTFAHLLVDALGLSLRVDDLWDANLPQSRNLTKVMQHILSQSDGIILLAIDEADKLFRTAFLFDFFGMVRSWHGLRAHPTFGNIWKRLDICLVTSTEPYLFIDRENESPFNVGTVIPLMDFTMPQVLLLNQKHGGRLNSDSVAKLHDLLNGQPYLTRKALYTINEGTSIDDFLHQAADDRGPFRDHLRYSFLDVAKQPMLLTDLRQIAVGQKPRDPISAYKLESAGLVRMEGNKPVPRCNLYARYFREH